MVQRQARELERRGVQVYLAGVGADGPLPRHLGLAAERIARFERGGVGAVIGLARWLRGSRCEVVHSHLDRANTLAIPAAWLAGVRTILSTQHTIWPVRRRRRLWLNRILARFASRVVVVSAAMGEWLVAEEGIPASKILHVPNPVSVQDDLRTPTLARAQLDLPPRVPIISSVGALVPEKDPFLLLRAFARVRKALPRALLVVAGDGPLRASLESVSQRRFPAGSVRWLGHLADPSTVLRAADLFVLSSKREGLPLVLLESAVQGAPRIATAVGGVRDTIRDGETGLLVAPGDCEALAGAMLELLRNPDRAREIALAARDEVSRKHDVRHSVDTILRLLRDDAGAAIEHRWKARRTIEALLR